MSKRSGAIILENGLNLDEFTAYSTRSRDSLSDRQAGVEILRETKMLCIVFEPFYSLSCYAVLLQGNALKCGIVTN